MRGKYVIQLKESLQFKIKEELVKFYRSELDLNDQELDNTLELAMSSRVSDLEGTIDIVQILQKSRD